MSEQQVLAKLDGIDDKVDKLLLWKATLDERCSSHRKETNGMHGTLYDNPGLVSKVQKLENCKKFLATNQTRWADFWMYVLKALVVAGVIAVVIFLFAVYKHVMGG